MPCTCISGLSANWQRSFREIISILKGPVSRLAPPELVAQLVETRLLSDADKLDPGHIGETAQLIGAEILAVHRVMRSSGIDPRGAACFHVGIRFPQYPCDRQPGEIVLRLYGFDWDSEWQEGEARESVMVFIGDQLPEEKIRAGFEAAQV